MKIKDIAEYLETIAPSSLQESYDNAGLLTGDLHAEVSGILLCLDCTEAVIDEAVSLQYNLIIAHHPVIFTGIKKITGATYTERTIINAIKNDIAIYTIHTNLDNVFAGVNKKIAEKLNLLDCKILSPKKLVLKKLVTFAPKDAADKVRNALFDAGAGIISNYERCSYNLEGFGTFRGNELSNPVAGEKGKDHRENETRIEVIYPFYLKRQIILSLVQSHPYEEVAYDIYSLDNEYQEIGSGLIGQLPEPVDEEMFLRTIKTNMQTDCIRYTALRNSPINKVAVCGGSGSFLLKEAIAAEADIFISADFKYHEFFDAEGKIIIADIGHFESEQYTVELISDLLKKKFATFALRFTKINTNPVKYL